jgi:hypothetical protein
VATRRKLARLAARAPSEWLLLCQFVSFVLCISVSLQYFSLPRLIDLLKWGAKQHFLQCFPLRHRAVPVDRLIVLADVAARSTRSLGCCLARSLLLFWLLKARGEPVALLAGVRKENTTVIGHAWLEREGRIIADSLTETSRFVPVVRFH